MTLSTDSTSATLPLSAIRVVALEQAVAAPLCTRHLADLGADVVKVERPEGDFARHYDAVVCGQSAYFVWLNRGKRSICLDVKRAHDRQVLDALLERADVVVHNLGPGATERLGLGWEALHERWPRLISCGITGYGPDGPDTSRKAYDLLLQGEMGILSLTGSPEEPAKVGISIADISAGMYAFSTILATLYEREHTGLGREIQISLLDSLAEWVMAPMYHQIYAGVSPARAGMRHNMFVPYGPYRVGDGSWVNLAVQNQGQWERLCTVVLGQPALITDPRYATNVLRVGHRAELEATVEAALGAYTYSEVAARLDRADVPYGRLNNLAEAYGHRQLQARQRWLDVDSPGGTVRAIVPPFNIGGLPVRAGAVPGCGEHTAAICAELGLEPPLEVKQSPP
jgi:crotonobetainyl-CoA:carnitine CoA-transferase CaiB-like acyl-CoA transferase